MLILRGEAGGWHKRCLVLKGIGSRCPLGAQGWARERGRALLSGCAVKHHLLRVLVSSRGGSFKLRKSLRNGEINQHDEIRCCKPEWLSWHLFSPGSAGAGEDTQFKDL